MLFLVGMVAPLYITLAGEAGFSLKPVTLVPLVMAPLLPILFPKEQRVIYSCWMLIPLLFIVYLAIRLTYSGNDSIADIARNFVNFIGYYVCLVLALASRSVMPYLRGYSLGIAFSTMTAVLGISVLGKSPYYYGTRWEGMASDPNFFANGVGIAFVVSVASLIMAKSLNQKMLSMCIVLISGVGLIGTDSRGGILACIMSLLICIAFTINSRNRNSKVLVLIIAANLCVGLMWLSLTFFFDFLPERMRTVLESPDAVAAAYQDDPRYYIHQGALEMIRENPAFGVGNEIRYIANETGSYQTPHNTYLFVLGLTGVIGFLLFYSIPVMATWRFVSQLLSSQTSSFDTHCGWVLGCLALFYLHGPSLDIAEAMHVWQIFAIAAYLCIELEAHRRNLRQTQISQQFRSVHMQRDSLSREDPLRPRVAA